MSSQLKKPKLPKIKSKLDPKRNASSIFQRKRVADSALTLKTLQLEYAIEYGINLRDRVFTWSGAIEAPMFDIVDAALSEFEADGRKGVTIRIHSEGGSIYEALAVVGRLRSANVSKVITEGYGQIMSAATMILACGNERRINKYAYFMHHETSYAVEQPLKVSEHEDLLEQVKKEEDDWAGWMAQFSKKTKKFWKENGCRKDAYFSPAQLVKLGVADEIFGR